jgi:hypothetical protein
MYQQILGFGRVFDQERERTMKRQGLILIASLVCLIISSTMILTANSQETNSRTQDKLEIEATPIKVGIMTEKQEQHSKLYNQYDTGNKIQDLLNLKDDEIQIRRSLPFPFASSYQVRSDVDEIKRITCAADAIVVGTVKGSTSQITASQSFLFTDYVLLIQQVLKNNSRNAIQQETEINITRPGGAILIGSKRLTAIDEAFLPLRKGKQYLLFLRYFPETESFASIETGESYGLNGNELQLLKHQSGDVITTRNNAISFVNEIKAVVGGPCN